MLQKQLMRPAYKLLNIIGNQNSFKNFWDLLYSTAWSFVVYQFSQNIQVLVLPTNYPILLETKNLFKFYRDWLEVSSLRFSFTQILLTKAELKVHYNITPSPVSWYLSSRSVKWLKLKIPVSFANSTACIPFMFRWKELMWSWWKLLENSLQLQPSMESPILPVQR